MSGCTDDVGSSADAGLPDAGVEGGLGDAGTATTDGGAEGPVVMTTLGRLEGLSVGESVQFLGIPYAKPPVGAFRFMPPEAHEPWSDVRPAKRLGMACPQPTNPVSAPMPYDEDCLTLNVYAPQSAFSDPSVRLPIVVWLHGGAFVTGGSNMYDGAPLAAAGPAIVVTLNYRLGALGFLSHPTLDAVRPADQPSGNDALRDQQLALSFVRDNAAAFRGDRDRITVIGQSAGAMSACVHMVSPVLSFAVERYVLQSGSCLTRLSFTEKADANAVGQRLVDGLCPGASAPIACLREKDPLTIARWGADLGIAGAGWTPVVNPVDPLLPVQPRSLILSGATRDAELLIGSNRAEWGLFALALNINPTTVEEAKAASTLMLADQSEADRSAILAHYFGPAVTDATARATYVRLMTDLGFRCPARALARLWSARGRPTYLYSFEEGLAYHAFEVPYLFGARGSELLGAPVPPLPSLMLGYWLQFATTGDPNGRGAPSWPAYRAESDRHLVLANPIAEGSALAKEDCDLWDALDAL